MQEWIGLHAGAAARAYAQESAVGTIDAEEGPVGRVDATLCGNDLPMKKRAGGCFREAQLGHPHQRGVRRKELRPEELAVTRLLHGLPWHRRLEAVRTHTRTLKRSERTPRPERCPKIGGERPHVESLAATDADHEVRQGHRFER